MPTHSYSQCNSLFDGSRIEWTHQSWRGCGTFQQLRFFGSQEIVWKNENEIYGKKLSEKMVHWRRSVLTRLGLHEISFFFELEISNWQRLPAVHTCEQLTMIVSVAQEGEHQPRELRKFPRTQNSRLKVTLSADTKSKMKKIVVYILWFEAKRAERDNSWLEKFIKLNILLLLSNGNLKSSLKLFSLQSTAKKKRLNEVQTLKYFIYPIITSENSSICTSIKLEFQRWMKVDFLLSEFQWRIQIWLRDSLNFMLVISCRQERSANFDLHVILAF